MTATLPSILKYGLIAGLIVGIPMILLAMTMQSNPLPIWAGMAIGYTTMLVALSAVFIAIKRRRDDDLGGVIRFLPALGLGLGISLVAALIYVAAWELALAVTGMDYGAVFTGALIEAEKARGVSGAALDQFIAGMRQFEADYRDPLYRMPMTFTEIFPVGVLVSLVSAGLLSNRRFLPARRAVAA
ncbi:MAG: DUF4199 domain-containing protein [Micropepsaceae bacterium]